MKKIVNTLLLLLILLTGTFGLMSHANDYKPYNLNGLENLMNVVNDSIVRIDYNINEIEIQEKIQLLKKNSNNIMIEYSRGDDGNIKVIKASNGSVSCSSDNFSHLIVTVRSKTTMDCAISDLVNK